jgi:hypothetical protein
VILDVSAWSVSGIDYLFPLNTVLAPGQVLCSPRTSAGQLVRSCTPPSRSLVSSVANWTTAERKIALRNAAGQVLWSVDYDDEGGWPAAADGLGASLEIIDPFGDPDDPANWRASAGGNGTPGSISPSPPIGAIVLNEVMAENASAVPNGTTYPDWVELRNTGASAVNLAGWSLSDDSNPRKFVFPANTSIAAGGYLVVWCDTNAAAPGLHTQFALGRNGDSVFFTTPTRIAWTPSDSACN